jgi:bleomycin hydrolase
MGANPSKEQEHAETFDEKHAEMVAVVEREAVESNTSFATSQEKYLTQSMAVLDLDEQKVKERYASLTPRALDKFSEHFWHDKKNQLAMNCVMANDPAQVMINHEAAIKNRHVFNVKLEVEGAATNQKQSGRCWIFAGNKKLNM